MDYTTFKNRFSGLPVILSKDVTERMGGEKSRSASGGRQELRNQLSRWQKRGLIVKLKKGMYLLNENDRKVNPSKLFVANQIYTPSCVSLEYALGFYGLIPERVVEVTSITTKKTLRITNPVGRFSYQHVTTSAFRGFKITKDENGMDVFIAEPEKGVLDFLYFNLARTSNGDILSPDIFSESYRFQNVGMLKEKRLLDLASIYGNPKLTSIVKLFCKFRKEHAKE